MSSYEVRAIKFIHSIYPYIENCTCLEEYDTAIFKYNMKNNRRVHFDWGSARFALITSDYVVKMNYNPENVARWGGCEEEHRFYNKAYNEGFDYLFAKTKPYYYKGVVFYIMPRIHNIGKTYWDADAYMSAEEKRWCRKNGLIDLHYQNYGWKNNHIVIIDYGANDYR